MVLEPLVTRLSLIPVTRSIFWLNRLLGKIQWYSVPSRFNASVGNSVAQFTFLLRGFLGESSGAVYLFVQRLLGGIQWYTLPFSSKASVRNPMVQFTLVQRLLGKLQWYILPFCSMAWTSGIALGGSGKVGCSHNQRTFIIEGKSFALAAAQTNHVRLLSNGSC